MTTDTAASLELELLSGPAPSSCKARIINFNETEVEEYGDYFAMVIEDILTRKECADLLALVQPPDNGPWPVATVTAYNGTRILYKSSRHCGRIIHPSQFLADRLLERILPHLPPEIVTLSNAPDITGQNPVIRKETWRIARLNDDLRFLKYEPGDYFRPHCDGHSVAKDGAEKSFLTVHLYLNGGGDDDIVEGGATRFAVDFEDPDAGKLDVNPKAGSLVIFQQRDMYHEEVEVSKGTKYTVRTDVMYQKV
ncbi:hypothetical protein F5B20DRAFT_518760 [Whalleya microplaca]|nr:hypothetical protein F5B20DRAFT_518760 [Whalleya microplaca]